MDSYLQREVAEAVASGASLSAIEQTIIDRTSLDEEERAALWLFAELLKDQPRLRGRASRRELVLSVG